MLRLVPFRDAVARLLSALDPWTESFIEFGRIEFFGYVLFLIVTIVASICWALLIIAVMDRTTLRSTTDGDKNQNAGQDDNEAPTRGRSGQIVLINVSGIAVMAAGILYIWLAFVGVVIARSDIADTEQAALSKLLSAVSEATTDAELADLLASGEPSVGHEIAVHASAGPTTQEYIALKAKKSVRVEMANEAERLWPEAGGLLARDDSDAVREAYANRRSDVSPALLVVLLHDESRDVAVAAFKNPLTPRLEKCGIVQEILEGSDGYEHYVNEIGEMVDYCRSVMKALQDASHIESSAE